MSIKIEKTIDTNSVGCSMFGFFMSNKLVGIPKSTITKTLNLNITDFR